MLLGRTQWQFQRCEVLEEQEPLSFLKQIKGVNRWWHRWAALRLLYLRTIAKRQTELREHDCFTAAFNLFEMLIKAGGLIGRLSQVYSFWTKSVYPRFTIEQYAFYKWRIATWAAKARRFAMGFVKELVKYSSATTYTGQRRSPAPQLI